MEQPRRAGRGLALVVSDAPDVVGGLVERLRVARIEVLRTSSCVEALALAAIVAPEVVVVDDALPGARTLCERLTDVGRAGQALLVLARSAQSPPAAIGCEAIAFDAAAQDAVLRRAEALVAESRDLRAASPLTGLPGNAAIRLALERRLAGSGPVALVYVDIDGFKPFNDHFGFLRGDEVLRTVAALLDREASPYPGTFVGHVGGDDFVLLAEPDHAEVIAHAVAAAFDEAVPGLYDPEDAARGYIAAESREGQAVRCPLLSISLGIATTVHRPVADPLELVDRATEMKHVAKQQAGSSVAVDRRIADRPSGAARPRLPVRVWVRRAAVAAAAALALALPGLGVAAAGATPGDRMWPAARLLEEARLAVAGDGGVTLRVELAASRLTDLVAAVAAGDDTRAALVAFEFARHAGAVRGHPGLIARFGDQVLLLERLKAAACAGAVRHPTCGAVAVALRSAEAAAGSLAGLDATADMATPSRPPPAAPPRGGPAGDAAAVPPANDGHGGRPRVQGSGSDAMPPPSLRRPPGTADAGGGPGRSGEARGHGTAAPGRGGDAADEGGQGRGGEGAGPQRGADRPPLAGPPAGEGPSGRGASGGDSGGGAGGGSGSAAGGGAPKGASDGGSGSGTGSATQERAGEDDPGG